MIHKRTQAKWEEPLILNKGGAGRRAYIPESVNLPKETIPDEWIRKSPLELPQVSELELVRHVVRLSQMIHGVDVGPYPLGSCTMKYNPKINERIARFPGFADMHPQAPEQSIQGTLEVFFWLQETLKKLTGFDAVTIQPPGGASGEFTGVLVIKAYHEARNDTKRDTIIIPDSAHGTNPASAAMAGFKVIEIPSTEDGYVDLEALKSVLTENIAGFMITNPNTLGLFEPNIQEICKMVHDVGGLNYLDGANFNGIVGVIKPAKMGFDVMHMNLHKTFTGPHGGGGPGSGPVAVSEKLRKYLPVPIAAKKDQTFYWDFSNKKTSIGKVHGYNGNFGIALRALLYILRNGGPGLRKTCETAVLNANYLLHHVRQINGLTIPKGKNVPCKHEFVASASKLLKETGVSTNDIAKAMLDYGVHSPTVYFPLIIKEALMIEPTESESKQSLDLIADVFKEITKLAYSDPDSVKNSPHLTSTGRLDEVTLAKKPVLSQLIEKKDIFS